MTTNRNPNRNTARPESACRCNFEEHRRAALVALACAALEVDELREAIAELHQDGADRRLQDAYNEVEHLESRLHDEARALHIFDDEFECSCGSCDESTRPLDDAAAAETPEPPCACAEGTPYEDEDPHPAARRSVRRSLMDFLRGAAAGAALVAFAAIISDKTDEG